MRDIIAEQIEILLSKAEGKINGKQLRIELKVDWEGNYFVDGWVETKFRCKIFCTSFFARRYYKKLVKKYGLKEIANVSIFQRNKQRQGQSLLL